MAGRMEAVRWEGFPGRCVQGLVGAIWMNHDLSTTLGMEAISMHDSSCGLDEEGEVQVTGDKRKGEESRMCICNVPVDVLAHIFLQITSFKDIAWASAVSRKWREAMREALAFREKLSFAGWRADDETVGRLVEGASSLLELDISLGRWGSRITNEGLIRIANSCCCKNLTSISLWGVTGITDDGVVELVTRAPALEHLNVGGTFITDLSVMAIAKNSPRLKVLNLWGCRHVTEVGMLTLAQHCKELTSINVWGMNITPACELRLTKINAMLQLKPSHTILPAPGHQ